jgi:ABC-type uncharacterized transport system permease subunit
LTVLLTSVPLILAATGELVVERSGVLNLGVEGMMLMGAVAAFGAASLSGNPYIGIVGGGLAGMAVAGVFALFVLGLATNQVATGLALTIFGTGLSGLIGAPLVGQAIDGLPSMTLPLLSDIPLIGVFFQLDIMAYLSILIVALTSIFLMRSRAGLILRSVGINHDSAHALGYNVLQVRFFAYFVWWVYGRARRRLSAAGIDTALGRRHDSRQGMDSAGIGCICIMATLAGSDWRRFIWRGDDYAACWTSARLDNTSTVFVDDALSGDDCCFGDNFRQR